MAIAEKLIAFALERGAEAVLLLNNDTVVPAGSLPRLAQALAETPEAWLATPRIAVASGTAFLVAQLLDVLVFDRLRQGRWWRAPLVSSV